MCLQETKLQEIHLTDPKLKIEEVLKEEGYESHYSCSTVKKGYSGTAVFIKKRDGDGTVKQKQGKLHSFFQGEKKEGTDTSTTRVSSSELGDIDAKDLIPTAVSLELGDKTHDGEGRVVCMDFPHFSILNCYVPNSGQKLERLDYRTSQWDKDLHKFMRNKEKERGVPVIWLGDLNVAHKAYDVWNDGAKHLAKQAGVTPEERESFQMQLDADGGAYVDAFRHLFPEAKGHYTFWSQRAGNRAPNKGLRLDYFICSKALLSEGDREDEKQKVFVRDSYMIHDQLGSDHCPIVLEMEIKK
jgi:exodeoxyribonuclease III